MTRENVNEFKLDCLNRDLQDSRMNMMKKMVLRRFVWVNHAAISF